MALFPSYYKTPAGDHPRAVHLSVDEWRQATAVEYVKERWMNSEERCEMLDACIMRPVCENSHLHALRPCTGRYSLRPAFSINPKEKYLFWVDRMLLITLYRLGVRV